MGMIDIIPDIHGQSAKLHAALDTLGWERRDSAWRHPEADRRIVLLGDFIDCDPENAAVIRRLRELMDSGKASAGTTKRLMPMAKPTSSTRISWWTNCSRSARVS